jgi:branched-chain amino acid transport system substrate-binding protein
MKGADAVLDWGYPNPIVVQIKQFAQNGIKIPTFTEASMDADVADRLITGPLLDNVYDVNYCNVFSTSPSPALKSFLQAYRARYHATPSQEAADSYDAVHLVVAAVNNARSVSPGPLNKAIGQLSMSGVCGSYHADGAHILNHQYAIYRFNANGTATTLKSGVFPTLAKGQA